MIWTAFTIGFFGSLHCIGMCGPIALVLPFGQRSRWQMAFNALLYNLGRTVTYTALGIIIGLLGKGIFLAGLQKQLSIFTGISLLLVVLFSINLERKIVSIPFFNQLFFFLKSGLRSLLKKPSRASIFFTGLLNGLLPCGLVYLALVGALTMGNIESSAVYMLFFGLGTIPLMLGATLMGKYLDLRFRNQLKKLYPVFILGLAVWFIVRGLNFYVPANFDFWEAMQNIPMCH